VAARRSLAAERYARKVKHPSHQALRETELGCLAIADISGYTTYLAAAELDHAQDVLEDLTETVVSTLAPPMKLAKVEGDAAFVYAPGQRIDASMLLDTIDATYFAFRRRLDAIDRATKCDCNACVLIPRLDLKFVVHHGRFGRQRIAGSEELSGSDVIIVHRLLKNRVADEIGHTGYAFFTDAVLQAMGLDPEAMRFKRHTEEIEGEGPITGWVEDLHDRWREERERRRVKVSAEEAGLTLVEELPAPRPMVWNYLTDPELRPKWQPGTLRIDETNPGGRRGAGTTNHCVHGKDAVVEEIRDWRPFDYFTVDAVLPMPMLGPVRITIELEETPTGTRVTERVLPSRRLQSRLAFLLFKRMYLKFGAEAYRTLERELEAATAEPAATEPAAADSAAADPAAADESA
jgi:uncharacterized protein YndB with AHSA1/START domain